MVSLYLLFIGKMIRSINLGLDLQQPFQKAHFVFQEIATVATNLKY